MRSGTWTISKALAYSGCSFKKGFKLSESSLRACSGTKIRKKNDSTTGMSAYLLEFRFGRKMRHDTVQGERYVVTKRGEESGVVEGTRANSSYL